MPPVTRGKGKAAPPPRLPRVKLVVGKKRPGKLATPEPAAIEDLDLSEFTTSYSETCQPEHTPEEPRAKKAKREISPIRFLLTLLVVFEKKLLVDETELKGPGSFNYQDFARLEAKTIGLHAMRKKLTLERMQGRATVRYGVETKSGVAGKLGTATARSGKGVGSMVTQTVDGPEDWEKVEAVAIEWVSGGKKDVRVELRVEYRTPLEEGEEDDFEDPYAEDIATPASTVTASKKTRRTATTILLEEMEKQQRAEKCYIPGLMQRWRCQNKSCKQYPDNACLVLAHEKQCRPLNAHILGIWDSEIKKGESTEHSFPLKIKMPPLASERTTKSSTSTTLPPPMQISVTAPPPQLPPWWLTIPNTHLAPPPPPVLPLAPLFSSPIRSNGTSSTELLSSFMEWFKGNLTPGNNEAIEAVEKTYIELKKEMYDLEGVRTMTVSGWKELKVPVGLGNRMSKAVKDFKNKCL